MVAKAEEEPGRLSLLLGRASGGDADAFGELFSAAYQDLCVLARARLRPHRSGSPLDTSALVHETFLRFANGGSLRMEHRPHFFRYASRVMRSVIIDTVREQRAQRRGGDVVHEALPTQLPALHDGTESEVLRVHEALEGLAQYDARRVDVVQMRYFAGLTEQEIALALGVTERTVRRDWEKARMLLLEALDETGAGDQV
jgi:RNA polymerase sigma factor (TIGR02999 family)